MEYDLEQEIAQFVAQVVESAPRKGADDLVSLLDGVRRDRFKGLLQVPGATSAGGAQRRHDLEQPGDVAGSDHRRKGNRGRTTADHTVPAAICPASPPLDRFGGRAP